MAKSNLKLLWRQGLSSDASVIWALMNKQPLSINELSRRVKRTEKHLRYRVIPLLRKQGIVKEIEKDCYVLYDYSSLEGIFIDLKKNNRSEVFLNEIANKIGEPPANIAAEAYRLARRYGIAIKAYFGR